MGSRGAGSVPELEAQRCSWRLLRAVQSTGDKSTPCDFLSHAPWRSGKNSTWPHVPAQKVLCFL